LRGFHGDLFNLIERVLVLSSGAGFRLPWPFVCDYDLGPHEQGADLRLGCDGSRAEGMTLGVDPKIDRSNRALVPTPGIDLVHRGFVQGRGAARRRFGRAVPCSPTEASGHSDGIAIGFEALPRWHAMARSVLTFGGEPPRTCHADDSGRRRSGRHPCLPKRQARP
jgi:hypothetical protein